MNVLDVPRSTLCEAFNLVIAQWPAEVRPGAKSFHINGGCNMREYNEVRSGIEDWATTSHFTGMLDDIIGSVEHYVSATIHDALKNLTILRPSDLDFEAFASRFDSHPNYRVISG
ncbi:MAG: hypothetical protein KKD64_02800 [Alphaproteobacteria bacterium]|nr:hypothetical protein [Alphaproteobacteria bacterium]MBU0793815.1 hypothetical protein [Alphaproteobacteria bacterium]MBU0874389.1 hypothetical protein [Alphaproteobacteria bacterium]MBU1768566.1 hypothetical protein [Alphaproteobacteria bacterium]